MANFLSSTVSLCKTCGRLLPARIECDGLGVWLCKICPEHGEQKALTSSNVAEYLNARKFFSEGSLPFSFATKMEKGCPFSCGLCPEHEQHICTPIIEITDYCDLACPICLVKNRSSYHLERKQVAQILDGLIESEGQIDVINLSGGEPTLNPNFREIVEECLSRKNILRVSVSTNGLNLAKDEDLLRFLGERNVIVSLQFDGFEENSCVSLRGRSILKEKLALIDKCTELDFPISLTVTVARKVNDKGLGKILDLLFTRKNILSTMFQPAVYTAKNHSEVRPPDAITIPDVVQLLDGAFNETVKSWHFSPLPCSHPSCFYLAYFLKVGENEFLPLKGMLDEERFVKMIRNRGLFGTDPESFRHIQDAIYDLWSGVCPCAKPLAEKALAAAKKLIADVTSGNGFGPSKAIHTGERNIKSIFIHQFMDRDTFDLSRARKCCTFYPQPDGRNIPACIHNCINR